MRLRCPHQNCPLDLSDDALGQEVRCPHCAGEFVVSSQHRDMTLDDDVAADSTFEDTTPIEQRLYDGLPPLSVMLAIRSGRPLDDSAAQAMTEDDWKALSAFESLLLAVARINTALWLGTIAVAIHFFFACSRFVELNSMWVGPTAREAFEPFAFPIAVGLLMFVLRKSRAGLLEAQSDLRLVRSTPWLAFLAGLAFVGATIWLVPTTFANREESSSCLRFLVMLCDFIAIAPWAMACWSSLDAVEKIVPPEVGKRLRDALAYLH